MKVKGFLIGPTLALAGVVLGACSPPKIPVTSIQQQEEERFSDNEQDALDDVRRALLVPSRLPHLVWRQKLTITAEGKTYHLEAVVQNDGQEFQVLALGPGGMKLFLVTQQEQIAQTVVFVPKRLALSPEYLLFDIQRSLFWQPEELCVAPVQTWQHRDFEIEDTCRDGRVVLREVSDGPAGSTHSGSRLSIEYSPAFDFETPPVELVLRHESRGYQIRIVQLESHTLP